MMRNSIIEMSAALGFFLTTDKNVFVIKMFFLYLAIHKANNRLISTWYFFFIWVFGISGNRKNEKKGKKIKSKTPVICIWNQLCI